MAKMREQDVEVVELHNLLAETMDIPEAKTWLLDRKIIANEVGLGLVDETRSFLDGIDSRELAEFLIGGLATDDPPRRVPHPTSPSPAARRRAGLPDAAVAQHALHPRHHVLALRRRDHEPAVLARPAMTRPC